MAGHDSGENLNRGARSVGLPPRPFLYTLDQIATILNVELRVIRSSYIYFAGRTVGKKSVHVMEAKNISAPNMPPDWRVSERELVRWMKLKGFVFYERSSARR